MPSLSLGAALLILGKSDGLPWTTTTWQGHTRILGIPWHTEPGAGPDEPAPHVPKWPTKTAQSVKTYAQNLWSAGDTGAQISYSARTFSDNDTAGRTSWKEWIKDNWGKKWNMNRVIDEVFMEYKCSPYDVLTRAKTRKVGLLISSDMKVHH